MIATRDEAESSSQTITAESSDDRVDHVLAMLEQSSPSHQEQEQETYRRPIVYNHLVEPTAPLYPVSDNETSLPSLDIDYNQPYDTIITRSYHNLETSTTSIYPSSQQHPQQQHVIDIVDHSPPPPLRLISEPEPEVAATQQPRRTFYQICDDLRVYADLISAREIDLHGRVDAQNAAYVKERFPELTTWQDLHDAGINAQFMYNHKIMIHWFGHLTPRLHSLYELALELGMHRKHLISNPTASGGRSILCPSRLHMVIPSANSPDNAYQKSWIVQLDAAIFKQYLDYRAVTQKREAAAAAANSAIPYMVVNPDGSKITDRIQNVASRLWQSVLMPVVTAATQQSTNDNNNNNNNNTINNPFATNRGHSNSIYMLDFRDLADFGWNANDLIAMGVDVPYLIDAGLRTTYDYQWVTKQCKISDSDWCKMGINDPRYRSLIEQFRPARKQLQPTPTNSHDHARHHRRI